MESALYSVCAAEAAETEALNIRHVLAALDAIDVEEKLPFLRAAKRSPHIIATETNPSLFATVERGDFAAAAKRLVRNWAYRIKFFGERAFRSLRDLSGDGALMKEEIEFIRTGFITFVHDINGRIVGITDFERAPLTMERFTVVRMRVAFWIYTYGALENPLSQTEGVRAIRIVRSRNLEDCMGSRKHLDFIQTAMPLRIFDFTFVVVPPRGARSYFRETVLPLIKSMVSDHAQVIMEDNVDNLRSRLVEMGFKLDSLPILLGGTWNYDQFDSWFAQQQQIPFPKPKKRKTLRQDHVAPIPNEAVLVHAVTYRGRGIVNHNYHDYSNVPPPTGYDPNRVSVSFLGVLHHVLSVGNDCLQWQNHGRAFRIKEIERLEKSQALQTSLGVTRASIIVQMLMSYGFKRITKGKDRGCFYHECFLRGLPHLVCYIQRPRDAHVMKQDPSNEPSLEAISMMFPLSLGGEVLPN